MRSEKKAHWHIDVLLQKMRVMAVEFTEGEEPECIWSRRAFDGWAWGVSATGLGTSDCRAACPAHLFFCGEVSIALKDLDARLMVMFPSSNAETPDR